jgi:hypothetical protein
MKNGTPTHSVFTRMGWFLGSGGTLLLLSAGLEFFARQTVEQASFATILELLYLAFWSYVLGVVILLLMPIVVLVMWLRDRVGHRATEPMTLDDLLSGRWLLLRSNRSKIVSRTRSQTVSPTWRDQRLEKLSCVVGGAQGPRIDRRRGRSKKGDLT